MSTSIPITIHDPVIAFVSYEGADVAANILTEWLKEPGTEPYVFSIVARVRDALLGLCNDTDVIMLESS